MITIDHLCKRRGDRLILDRIGFVAAPGRVTGFLGPNGAGKSSTLRILLGLDRATAGTALINGQPYIALPRPLTAVGAALDGTGAHPDRTGRHHLAWVAASNGLPRQRIEAVLAQVELTAAADRRIGSYSLGMGRRLALATALLGDPPVLVLDEPLNGLDPGGIRWLRNFLRARADAGGTILLSSHQMGELALTVDDLVMINQGRIVTTGPLASVIGDYQSLEDAFFAALDTSGNAATEGAS